jgi:lysozyme family protein
MVTSRERSKFWVEQELPAKRGLIDELWIMWELDACPAGLDYFLLHIGVAFGKRLARDWVRLCSQDLPAKEVQDLTASEAQLLISRIEVVWRRRLRSSPGWKEHRSAWVNIVNRVARRARNLAQEALSTHTKELACVS